MKKVSLLISTMGGAMAGYLLSNKKLRDELSKAKDPEAAAKTLGKYLQKDGKKLAAEMQDFLESDEVQGNITKAKKYAKDKAGEAKGELDKLIGSGKQKASTAANKAKKSATKKAKTASTKAKKTAKKTAAKAEKSAKSTGRRIKAKTRKVS